MNIVFDKNKTPTEMALLPSCGKVYSKEHPFHNLSYIPIKTMTIADEEILLNVAFAKMGITTMQLLKSCICLPNIDFINESNVLAGDIAALLYSLRINSYGRIYDPTIKCPSCDVQNQLSIDMASFPVNTLDLIPINNNQNLFVFEMPSGKSIIEYSFLTFSEAEELAKMLNDSEDFVDEFFLADGKDVISSVKTNTYVTSTLMKLIKSVNGNTSRSVISKYVKSMRIGDSMRFRNFVKDTEPNIRPNVSFVCKNECGYEASIPLAMNHSIFGIKPEHKVEVLLEPHFILTYYSGFSFEEYRNYPVAYKKFYIDRMNEEISKAQKAQSDIPTKAPHHNGQEVRTLTGKVNTNTTNSKLQRFT